MKFIEKADDLEMQELLAAIDEADASSFEQDAHVEDVRARIREWTHSQ